jgi:hypothetical protein
MRFCNVVISNVSRVIGAFPDHPLLGTLQNSWGWAREIGLPTCLTDARERRFEVSNGKKKVQPRNLGIHGLMKGRFRQTNDLDIRT